MFDQQAFVEGCVAALQEADPPTAVQSLIRDAVADPAAVAAVLSGEDRPMVDFLFKSDQLTVANVRTAPGSVSPIHNHRMWAVIGMYEGQEDNHLYGRCDDGSIEERELKSLKPQDIFMMDPELIHAIENPLAELNGALHVYGGDLKDRPGRSLWDPETDEELDYEFARVLQFTEQMNKP